MVRVFLFKGLEVEMTDKKKELYENSHLYRVRHSSAHVMAEAVLDEFPGGKVAIGPAIEDGFYYDFDLPRPLTPEDLKKIEKRMRSIIQGNFAFESKVISPEEGRKLFKDQPFKIELIEDLQKGGLDEHGNPASGPVELTIYTHDHFTDLCRGPNL
jgi:threonyl-tRNA synthetase